MKFFIDSKTDEIRKAWALGVIDCITTDPSLILSEWPM
jgi:transaldolase